MAKSVVTFTAKNTATGQRITLTCKDYYTATHTRLRLMDKGFSCEDLAGCQREVHQSAEDAVALALLLTQ